MSVIFDYLIYLLLIVLVPLYFYYSKLSRLEKFFKNYPTPPTEPFFGHARRFTSTSAFLKTLYEFTTKYGSVFHLKIGPVGHAMVCSDPNLLQCILTSTKSVTKSRNLKFLKPWLGNGLVLLEGEKWKKHRKLITPTFHFKILERFVNVFESSGDVLIEKLSKIGESNSVDIYEYITRCTLDIICETAMGTKMDVQNKQTSSYFQSVKEMCRIFLVRTMSITKQGNFIFRCTKDYAVQTEALKCLHGYTEDVITNKRDELSRKKNNSSGKKGNTIFLDLLLENTSQDDSFSDKYLRDEVNTFMFGGHDTTATATSFVLYCLANNDSVQDQVFKEQEQLFHGEKNPDITYADLQEMKYLECVIKESMRIYPPVALFGRETCEDINYNGTIIPKNVPILLFTYGLHMNPKIYPNPEEFDPTRFEDTNERHPFSYIPFSAGPRNCIGQKYAMLEMKSLISKVVRHFELGPATPHHELNLAAELVLKSLNGVKISLKLR